MARNLNQRTVNHFPAVNTAAIASTNNNPAGGKNPGSEGHWRITQLVASYGSAPTGGRLTITSDNRLTQGGALADADGQVVTLLDLPVGAQPIDLSDFDLRGLKGGILIATLAAAGAAVQGGVFFAYEYEGA